MRLLVLLIVVLAAGCQAAPRSDERPLRVVVFSATAGFRHDSIPDGVAAVQRLGAEQGWEVVVTERADELAAALPAGDVVVFLNTTGDVLDERQQAALVGFVEGGGGFVGVHAATDTEHDWPWYGTLVAARFASHPAVQPAAIDVVDRRHPSTAHLPERWTRTDEWYDFDPAPPASVRILARLDESSYEGGAMGDDHPFAWCHDAGAGRAWYTAGGHTAESFREAAFLAHLRGGIAWAGRRE